MQDIKLESNFSKNVFGIFPSSPFGFLPSHVLCLLHCSVSVCLLLLFYFFVVYFVGFHNDLEMLSLQVSTNYFQHRKRI